MDSDLEREGGLKVERDRRFLILEKEVLRKMTSRTSLPLIFISKVRGVPSRVR